MLDSLNKFAVFIGFYLIVCGGLYHLSFWDTFDINGLTLISSTDILKDSLYQLLDFNYILYFGYFIVVFFGLVFFSADKNWSFIKLSAFLGFISPFAFLYCILKYEKIFIAIPKPIMLGVFFIFLSGFSFTYLTNYIKIDIKSVNYYIKFPLFILPLLAFLAGKDSSQKIFNNQEYLYTTSEYSDSIIDTLKLIAKTNSYHIFTDLKNSQLKIINNNSIDTIILKHYSKK